MHIRGFLWDEGNVIHLEMGHGIEAEETEEVFFVAPLFHRTRKGRYSVLGPTMDGRYIALVFELKKDGVVRVITGWDMKTAEKRFWRKHLRR